MKTISVPELGFFNNICNIRFQNCHEPMTAMCSYSLPVLEFLWYFSFCSCLIIMFWVVWYRGKINFIFVYIYLDLEKPQVTYLFSSRTTTEKLQLRNCLSSVLDLDDAVLGFLLMLVLYRFYMRHVWIFLISSPVHYSHQLNINERITMRNRVAQSSVTWIPFPQNHEKE